MSVLFSPLDKEEFLISKSARNISSFFLKGTYPWTISNSKTPSDQTIAWIGQYLGLVLTSGGQYTGAPVNKTFLALRNFAINKNIM